MGYRPLSRQPVALASRGDAGSIDFGGTDRAPDLHHGSAALWYDISASAAGGRREQFCAAHLAVDPSISGNGASGPAAAACRPPIAAVSVPRSRTAADASDYRGLAAGGLGNN